MEYDRCYLHHPLILCPEISRSLLPEREINAAVVRLESERSHGAAVSRKPLHKWSEASNETTEANRERGDPPPKPPCHWRSLGLSKKTKALTGNGNLLHPNRVIGSVHVGRAACTETYVLYCIVFVSFLVCSSPGRIPALLVFVCVGPCLPCDPLPNPVNSCP